jgi:branched-chain amino acid transport system substrate-binding protein
MHIASTTRRGMARLAALLPAAALAATAGGAFGQATYPETFKMGAVLNLTGPTAGQGADFRAGLELAAMQWNAKGGLGGSKIEIIFEDHAAQPAKAVTAAQKLIQVDKVKVLANVYSSPVLAVVPIAQREQVLQVSAGATSPRLVNVSKYFMTSVANAALEAEVVLAFARKKLGASKVAILYGNDDFGTGMRDAVKQLWPAGGGTIVAEEGIEPAKADLAAVSAKLAAAKPDGIYVALAGVAIGAAVKQLREAGYTGPLLSHQGYEAPELFSVAGSAAANSFWTSAAITVGKAQEEAFVAAFKAAFKREPTIYVRTHFDLGMSLFEAVANLRKEGKAWTAENIRAALLGLGTTTGVLGAFSYREDGTALRALDIKTFKDGKPAIHLTAADVESGGIFSFKAK